MEHIKSKIDVLPHKPGVYQYLDAQGKLLYVGKARDLKKRVSSYFKKSPLSHTRLSTMIKKIADVKHFVVENESDALLLENSMIKAHQPRYNVQLKDDKTFPWICIKNEPFPRVFHTRNVVQDGSEYYGPYTSVVMVRTLLDLIRRLYPLRTCKYKLTRESIQQKKFKVCLEYHLGNCPGPCEGLQDEASYQKSIQQIRNILKGNIQEVLEYLKKEMVILSNEQRFERAQMIKDKLSLLEKYRSKSAIVNARIHDVDVFSYVDRENEAFVNFIKVSRGSVIQSHSLVMKKKLNESQEDLLATAITEIRQKTKSNTGEIIAPFQPDMTMENVRYTIPKLGDKKKLLELSKKNAKYFMFEHLKKTEKTRKEEKSSRVLEQIRKDLGLKENPVYMECFDNSNIQGKNPVAACVVFRNGKPSRSEYRHYNIKTVPGIDDYASMAEVILRRYKRLLDEKKELPQLVIIDGGKGQLNAARKSLKNLGLEQRIPLIGIAKRLEEVFLPDDPVPLYIDKNSPALKTIQQIRNEAHRFGISFHRKKREKEMIRSELDRIGGIGPATGEKLILKYGSLDRIRSAKKNELVHLIGKSKTGILMDHFQKNDSGKI